MNIYFEALDSGFIVYKDGKKTAIRYPNELIEGRWLSGTKQIIENIECEAWRK